MEEVARLKSTSVPLPSFISETQETTVQMNSQSNPLISVEVIPRWDLYSPEAGREDVDATTSSESNGPRMMDEARRRT
ncbi:hypothetical protein AMTR_s00084p00073130 [Amborella trichopoda]|uniref:Uncharacterized protein n=1 Tax=Amborella trichopoda TaxID=13333 RepID=W1P5Q5_AMBTC|nr:hypothetical protein AMTR_s00084p00073130 [Amborella trichopoda]